ERSEFSIRLLARRRESRPTGAPQNVQLTARLQCGGNDRFNAAHLLALKEKIKPIERQGGCYCTAAAAQRLSDVETDESRAEDNSERFRLDSFGRHIGKNHS